jgi:hypothetical protein
MSVIIKLLSKFDDSGLRKAKSGFGGLTKSLGAIGIGFGLKQMTDGLLDAAKAASIDAKSMQLLNNQLVRNANATKAQVTQNNKFIDSLALQVGIADDQLRPAQARLARATGSTAKSQELLKLALDASAVSGKPLSKVSQDLAKAFNGNTTSLVRLFPELRKSKNIFADLEKIVAGTALEQADPFARMNVAFGELQEKLGGIILPYILDFIDTMMKPGGAIDQVGKFLEDVSNPKTEAGQTFIQVKDAISQAVTAVKEFFAFFGDGNAVKGFANIASSLVQALPALLALKAIMTLASGGKAIASLVTAMSIIAGKSVTPTAVPPVAAINPITAIAVGSQAATLAAASTAQDIVNKDAAKTGMKFNVVSATFTGSMALPQSTTGGTWWDRMKKPATNVTINVTKADPKATVDALSAYLKQNGSLPSQLFWNARN